jgi:hypothetical protein
MQRPSAQGIADLFRGNPAPLQQRIQMEQQGKPGLPPDLQKLIALNLVTNEKDAMAREQAMSQLAKMQGQQGKPPTVLESVQEQARQKMQAQQVQAQRQQQAIQAAAQQAGPGPVPPGTPQPEAQPQGIDDLPVEFGLAGGGIVAFQNRGSVPEAEPASDSMGGFTSDPEREALNALRLEEKNAGRRLLELQQKAEFLERAGAPQAGAVRAQLEAEQRKLAGREVKAEPRREEAVYRPEEATRRADYEGGIRQLASRPRPPQVASAPAPAPAKMAPEEEYLRNQFASMDPERARNEELRRFRELVPAPDTTQRDAAIKALQEERRRHTDPEGGFAGLMEYLGQIAATPRGMSSFEAGAAGARGVQNLQKQRADQRMELGMKIIEQEQGKLDTLRAYGKETYNVGKKEFDQIFGDKLKLAGDLTKNDLEKRKMAQEMTIKEMELRARSSEEAGRANRDIDSRVLQGYINKFGGDVVKAHQEMAKAQGKEKLDPYTTELMKKIADAEVAAAGMPGKIGEEKRAELARLKQQLGLVSGTNTGGAGVPLPSNASAANLNVGTVYQTARGPAKWTGTGFTPI